MVGDASGVQNAFIHPHQKPSGLPFRLRSRCQSLFWDSNRAHRLTAAKTLAPTSTVRPNMPLAQLRLVNLILYWRCAMRHSEQDCSRSLAHASGAWLLCCSLSPCTSEKKACIIYIYYAIHNFHHMTSVPRQLKLLFWYFSLMLISLLCSFSQSCALCNCLVGLLQFWTELATRRKFWLQISNVHE